MKSHSKRILSLVFALLMLFQQVLFAAQTVDLFNPELGAKTVDLIPGEDDTNTVDLLTPSEEDSTKTVDLLNPEQPSATIEQQKPIIEKNENKTVDTITPRGDDIVPAEGKKSTTTIVVGGDEIEEGKTNENSEISPEEIILPEENEKEGKKDASFEDEEHHENAGVLPWSTDLVKPWSIYRAPKTVYRPGEDLDLTELLVEIKTGRSGSLYNIEDLINDEFTTITRTRKSDGQKVRLDDKIYEDETMTIHMDGCQNLTIDFTVDENLKDEAKAFEAFQQNLIREEFRNGLDFSLYLIKKGEKENPVVAYSLDPHKLTPIGNGVDKKLKDGPLFDLKDINTWDRYNIETIGKVKAILERSAELKDTENIRKKLITQLAIWNVTSNIIPKEIDATVSEPTEIAPELKPAEETKENPEEDKKDEPIEITEPTTPEEETENIEKENEKVEDTKDETVEIKTEEKVEEKIEAEESEKIEEKAPVQSTVHKIVFNAKEIDVPYDDIELSDEEYELYKELTSLEAVELKNEDENLKIYEPVEIEETENQYADLVTIGESDIDSIERVATEVTFDAVEYSFQNLYHTLETSSMLGFGQPRDFNVLLKATMKASRKIVKGDKFEVEILSKTLPILNGEEGRANDIRIDGKVVATAEYIAEEHKIVYTFVEDLDTDKVEIEQEFKQIKEEKAALLNMLDVSENLVLDAVRGAEGAEDSEENPDELEISPEFEENLIQLKLGNTPVQYNGVSFETKKFRLKTTMTAKAAPVWRIEAGTTFTVNIGQYLKPEYDNNSEPILKKLYDPDNPNEVIAEPKYDSGKHIITYTYTKTISNTKKIDIDQMLAFDTEAIGDKKEIDVNITVTPKNNHEQKMQPIKVRRDDPRTVIPSIFEIDVNENGEPNFNDTYEFFEYGPSYKVTFDAKSTPVVVDRKMVAIDWEITFDGHGRKLGEEDLKLITNFTAVKNSGIETIEQVKLNDSDENIDLKDNKMGDKFLINDSKNVVGKQSSDKYVFTFTTPVEKQQQAYVLDISAKLKGINKTGAVRLFQPYIDTIDLSYESPTILKCSNRVTNSGEFLSENKIRWILTEEVSSGDAGKLPVATRTLSGNQQIESSKVAYYILNNVDGNNKDDGKMQKVGETIDLNKKILEEGKLKEGETFAPGTIAVYEIITTVANQEFGTPNYYSFGDNVISLYRDYDVNITWTSQVEREKFPDETLYLKEKKDENGQIYYGHIYETVVEAQQNGEELNPEGKISKIENVKKWRIVNGKPEEIKYELSQKFGNESAINRGIEYKELTNSFNIYEKRYEVLNTIAKSGESKTANITVLKRDASDETKKLAGAKFSLIGDGSQGITYSGVTDIDGKIVFNDVPRGTYVLQEEMAPEGYRINRQQDIVTVDDKGNVKWTKNNIKTENIELPYDADGKYATECLYHNGSDLYPSYMNALSYATVDDNNNINYYIYLKPDVKSGGNGTDQNTILAINYDNISKTGGIHDIPVKIYDVNPNNRAIVQEAFKKKEIEKTFNSIIPEGKLIQSNYSITSGDANINRSINNSKFSLSIPQQRFAGDWGFVLKFTLKLKNDRLNSNLWYNWVTDGRISDSNGILDNESDYRKTFIPKVTDRKSGKDLANSPELLILNEQKDAYPIVVVTKDDERKILSNVELTLIDKSTNNIIRVGRTDKEGVCKFENVPEGEYLLKETEVPNGLSKYNLNYNITVNHDGTIKYLVTNEVGKPVEPGEKYLIGIIQDPTVAEEGQKPEIKVLENSMKLNETSGWGQKRGVWEENKYEAYDFSASFLINNSKAGEEIVIDFDDNWNVTQWSGSMPNIVTRDGHVVATAELDTNTNKLTYKLTDYVNGKSAINASLFIQSIRPSKYYVLTDKNHDGTAKKYEFNDKIITPTESVSQKTIVEPDLGEYFGEIADNSPLFITQNVDVKREGKDLELRNVTVFNPDGKENLVSDELYIYYGMTNEARVAEDSNRIEPAYKPKKIVVYKVKNPDRKLLPVNSGIKPAEKEKSKIYNMIAEFEISEDDIRKGKEFKANEVSLSYKESRVDIKTNKVPRLNEKENVQFIFKFSDVKSGAGYVIEEFYDVTDEPAFRNNYILTSTYYHSKWGNKGGIAQMKPKSNAASADDGIIIDSGDPNKDLTIFHYRNKNRFIVKKVKKENGTVEPLANAWFTLKDEKGNLIKEDSSNINGIIVFDNLKPGTYYLTESVAPNGYSKLDKTVTVIVKENGTVEFTGDKDPNIEIISGSKTTKKYKKIYKEQKFEQPLTKQSRFPNFMNISSKILKNSSKIFNDNDDFVTSRIYLNQSDDSTSGKGPDKDTKLFLNASYAKSTDITLYKIPKAEKGNIDDYIANNPYARIDLTNNSEVKKMPDGSIWFRGPEDSRWNGDAYVIEITAKYGELQYEPGQRKEVDRVVDYTWIYEKDNTFVKGRVGVKSILSSLELADQTQTGDDIYEVPENDGAVIQVTNKRNKAKVTIVKVDENKPKDGLRKVLPGAKFGLFDKEGKNLIPKDGNGYVVLTDKEGKATFKDLEPGTYTIKEIKAPSGYEETDMIWKVVVGENNEVKVEQKEIKQFFNITNPEDHWIYNYTDANLFGDWNPRNVLDVYPIIEDKNDGTYSVKVNFAGLNNSDFSSSFKLDFDNEHFKFYDDDINNKGTYEEDVKFNSNKKLLEFRFKPKSKLNNGEYTPLKNVRYVDFDMNKSFLPKLTKTDEEELTSDITPKTNPDNKEFSFYISNKFKGFEVEFKKIDAKSIGKPALKYLKGAKFRIEIKDKDKEEFRALNEDEKTLGAKDTCTSDANGTISFKGLKPGTYRLIEETAPEGYNKILGDAVVFYINPEGEVSIIKGSGSEKLNAENNTIGNIPKGKQSFTILKKNEADESLKDVEFTLYSMDGKALRTGVTNGEGKIEFKDLDFGSYILKETKTVNGYILDARPRVIKIGKDFAVPEPPENPKDISTAFVLVDKKSNLKSSAIREKREEVVKPNSSESVFAELYYNINQETEIKPGDTFSIEFNNNVDLDGVDKTPDSEFDLYGPFGKFAKAKVEGTYPDRRKINYTVTNYVAENKIDNIYMLYPLYINRFENKFDSKEEVPITATIGNQTYTGKINVVFSDIFDTIEPGHNIMAYMRELHQEVQQDGNKFKSVVYVNPKREPSYKKRISFTSNRNFRIDSVKIYKVNDSKKGKLPQSFGIDFNKFADSGLTNNFKADVKMSNDKKIIEITETENFQRKGKKYGSDAEYVLEVDGTVINTKILSDFVLQYHFNEYYQELVNGSYWQYNSDYNRRRTFVQFYYTDSNLQREQYMTIRNFKNKIEFIKVDGTITGTADDKKQQGASQGSNEPIGVQKPVFASTEKPLPLVDFRLMVLDKKTNKYKDYVGLNPSDTIKTSDTNGKFGWEGLPEGKYQVVEIKALPGYSNPKNPVSSFEVNENGEIINIKANTNIIKNYKKPDIEFQKVDGNKKTVKLEGAEFTLYKAKKNTNGALQFGMVDNKFNIIPNVDKEGNPVPEDPEKGYTVKSGKEGKFKFEKLEDGIYAVKETKAPAGYTKLLNYVFYFKVEGTKIYRVNKLGEYVDDTKDKNVVQDAGKDEKSLIVDMEKNNAQVNPIQIENFKAEYPSTGGVGALPFVFIGMMIMMVGAYMFIRRRDALYE